MILSLIRRVGRAALRQKWAFKDAVMYAMFEAELKTELPPKTFPTSKEILKNLESTYREDPQPGYYVDSELAALVYSLSRFYISGVNNSTVKDYGYIGCVYNDQGMMVNVFRLPSPPTPSTPADRPGYFEITR